MLLSLLSMCSLHWSLLIGRGCWRVCVQRAVWCRYNHHKFLCDDGDVASLVGDMLKTGLYESAGVSDISILSRSTWISNFS